MLPDSLTRERLIDRYHDEASVRMITHYKENPAKEFFQEKEEVEYDEFKTINERENYYREMYHILYGDRYTYPEYIFLPYTILTLTCPEHGEFKIGAMNHAYGMGCPTCDGRDIRLNDMDDNTLKIVISRIGIDLINKFNSDISTMVVTRQKPETIDGVRITYKSSDSQKGLYKDRSLREFIYGDLDRLKPLGIRGNGIRREYKHYYEFFEITTRDIRNQPVLCKKCNRYFYTNLLMLRDDNITYNSEYNCPYCRDEILDEIVDIKSFNTTKSPSKSIRWCQGRIDSGGVTDKYKVLDYDTKCRRFLIRCKEHGEVTATRSAISFGKFCSSCMADKKNVTSNRGGGDVEVFKAITELMVDEKYTIDFDTFVSNSAYVDVYCRDHGHFKVTGGRLVSTNITNVVCPQCQIDNINENKSLISRIKDARKVSEILSVYEEVHGDRFDYSRFETNITKKRSVNYGAERSLIICPEHGEFMVNPIIHIKTHGGCPDCKRELEIKKEKDKKDLNMKKKQVMNSIYSKRFFKLCEKVYNGRYDYSEATFNGLNKPITNIHCLEHDEYFDVSTARVHKYHKAIGGVCPKCYKEDYRGNW